MFCFCFLGWGKTEDVYFCDSFHEFMEVGFESLILVGVFNYDLLHQSMLVAIPSWRSAEDFTHQEESNHLCLDDPITSSPLIPFTKHICIAFSFASDLLSKSWIVWSRNRAFNRKAPKPTNPDLLNATCPRNKLFSTPPYPTFFSYKCLTYCWIWILYTLVCFLHNKHHRKSNRIFGDFLGSPTGLASCRWGCGGRKGNTWVF